MGSFSNLIGNIQSGSEATIRFFGKVTEESAREFNAAFDYLENCVRPSLIKILINSEGGSVLYGMSVFSTISNSRIPTECINEGIAASMGSIIWSAGRRSLMRDYAILMIHNPSLSCIGKVEKEENDMVRAFSSQLETIYRKRFGLKPDHVRAIMDGKAGKDGTFFDAESAVKAGIIPFDNILPTSPQIREKVRHEIEGVLDAEQMQRMMCAISASLSDSVRDSYSDINSITKKIMNEDKNTNRDFGAIAASLGMQDKDVADVMARISELLGTENKLTTMSQALNDAKTVIAGNEATILNLQTNLKEVTASLKTYEEKEKLEKQNRIQSMVSTAKAEGKITETDTEKWLEMAEANPELTESILASIPAREQITKEIASDPDNIKAASAAVKSVEAKVAEQIKAVVGDFEFKKLG